MILCLILEMYEYKLFALFMFPSLGITLNNNRVKVVACMSMCPKDMTY